VLAYTDTDVDAPGTWVESDAKLIDNPQMVKLHSFDTKVCPRSRPMYLFGISITDLVLDWIANSQFLCWSGRFIRWTRWCRTRRTSGTRSRVCTSTLLLLELGMKAV